MPKKPAQCPLFDAIESTAYRYGFIVNRENRDLIVHTSSSQLMTLKFRAAKDSDAALMIGVVATFGYHFHGERTGIADLIGTVWALTLRADSISSVNMIYDEGFIEGEYPDRYLAFEQPGMNTLSVTSPDMIFLEKLFASTSKAGCRVDCIFTEANFHFKEEAFWHKQSGPASAPVDWSTAEDWGKMVASKLQLDYTSVDVNYDVRESLGLSHFLCTKAGVKLLKFNNYIYHYFRSDVFHEKLQCVEGVSGTFYITNQIKNHIPSERLSFAKKLMGLIHDSETEGNKFPWLMLPTESELYLMCPHGIVSVAADCSIDAFVQEKAKVRQLHEQQSRVLFSPARFSWATKIDDERFEQLVFEIVRRESGVVRTKKVGSSRSPDGGRDLLVEWYLPSHSITSNPAGVQSGRAFRTSAHSETDQSDVQSVHRIVVQCKAFTRAVDKSKVTDIRDTVDYHQSDGYLLVAYPSLTAPLVDHLDALSLRGQIWVDWWTKDDIEERLSRYPEIVNLFRDLVTMELS